MQSHSYDIQLQSGRHLQVSSCDHLIQVRRVWDDYSPVVSCHIWVDGCGWIAMDASDMHDAAQSRGRVILDSMD